ncbi:hypothetical protein GCM10027395_05950 [Giesbergeria sinuosa]
MLGGALLLGAWLLPPCVALAQETNSESKLKLSGYVSIVGGKTISGTLDSNYSGPTNIKDTDCPCYVADWSNAGVYGDQFTLRPESRIGIQGKYSLNDKAGLTVQLVSRGTRATPDLAWAFASYKLNENFELYLGRKRIPLYYYSDFQDIGVAYPWVSPPPELYGWEATNYNGASLRYNRSMGDTSLTASVFAGQEKVRSSRYQKLYYPVDRTKVQWNNIIGGDVEVNHGPLTLRAVLMGADARTTNRNEANFVDSEAALRAYGLAANLDFDRWFVLSEFTQLTRKYAEYKVTAPAVTIGAGMRLGKWTPFINYARFKESTTDLDQYAPGTYHRTSMTLRYDLSSSSAVKAQVDRNIDETNNFGGHSTVFRISYDRVF